LWADKSELIQAACGDEKWVEALFCFFDGSPSLSGDRDAEFGIGAETWLSACFERRLRALPIFAFL
jgi:hypothetical protein